MLHHIVYKTRERRDAVCGDTQSFYGTGEENETLRFPPGYGYRVRRRDRWLTGWMLMNHRARAGAPTSSTPPGSRPRGGCAR